MFESSEYACESALKDYFKGENMINKVFSGIIERLFVNERQTARGSKQAISIANNKVYYGLGLHDKDTFEVDGVVLKEGMEVEFEYSDGKYKNVVIDTLKIVQQEVPKVKKQQVDKSLPIRLGNSLTVAQNFTKTHIDVVAIASKQVLPEVDKLRDKLATQYPNMDDYATGARVGQCVVIASQFTKDINSYIEVAEQLFHEMCNAEEELKNGVSNEVKQDNKNEENDWAPNNLSQSPRNVAPPVYNIPPMDFDDSIPFAPIGLQYPQILWSM